MMGSNLSKSNNAPARKITISHTLPSVMGNSTTAGSSATANIMAVSNHPQEKDARHHVQSAQSATCPSPVDSDWLEEDWDDEIEEEEEEKGREKQRKEELEKASGYYPPEPIYNPNHEREIPILVTDLVPVLIPGENKSESQERKEDKERIENRRIVEGINDDEDLDYYLDLDSIYQSFYKGNYQYYTSKSSYEF